FPVAPLLPEPLFLVQPLPAGLEPALADLHLAVEAQPGLDEGRLLVAEALPLLLQPPPLRLDVGLAAAHAGALGGPVAVPAPPHPPAQVEQALPLGLV